MSYITLTPDLIIEIHDTILREEPGLSGLSANKSIEGALGRIKNHMTYAEVDDLHDIAALYGIAIAQGHVFNDGNKRTALMAMYSFLRLNGYTIYADENETTEVMVKVAKKEITLIALANWLRINSVHLEILKKTIKKLKSNRKK